MSDRTYHAPQLDRLSAVTITKHRLTDIAAATSLLDEGYDVKALLEEYGSPLFLLSEKALRQSFRDFHRSFAIEGFDTVVAYSYKTNYLPALCSILHEEGAWAEVVSGMEYILARSLGVPAERIVFNGPHKTREEITRAIAEGALLNVDGFDDLKAVIDVAGSVNGTARIGLRINFLTGAMPWTKFGFNAENGDARRALQMVRGAGKLLRLEALHNHGGTFQTDPRVYGQAVAVLTGVARQARTLKLKPSVIDLGGGYPSSNRLKPALAGNAAAGARGNLLGQFAQAVGTRLARARDAFGPHPTLMLEPGRAIVDSAMQLACTVVATKEIPGQGAGVIVDAGVNVLPTAYWYDHEVNASGQQAETAERRPVTIYGPMCMQIDVLRERAMLPPLSIGSPLLISNVGAYCLTQSMQFIQPRPAVVLIGPRGPEPIRRRESWRDVFALDRVPDRLRSRGCRF